MTRSLRSLLVTLHRWLGITLGLVLTLVAVSGSLLASATLIAKIEVPQLAFPEGVDGDRVMQTPATSIDIAHWIAATSAQFPQLAHAIVIAAPGAVPFPSSVPLLAGPMTQPALRGKDRHYVVSINPLTGEPIAGVVLEETFLGKVLAFHATLTAGKAGYLMVAVSGFFALVSLGTGLYLWWPRVGEWRRALRVRSGTRGRRWLLSLHSVAAIWLFVPLAIVVLSGSYLLTPAPYEALTARLSSIREATPPTTSTCGRSIGISAAIAVAQSVHPGASLRLAIEPEAPCEPYRISLMSSRSANPKALHTEVWVDRQTGAVLAARHGAHLTAAEYVQSWMGPLHNDLASGAPGAFVVALMGLLVPLLYFTGLLAWFKQLKLQRARYKSDASGLGT